MERNSPREEIFFSIQNNRTAWHQRSYSSSYDNEIKPYDTIWSVSRYRYSPRVISPMRLDEVHVAVLGKESHQLIISPERRERERTWQGNIRILFFCLCLNKRKFHQMTVVCWALMSFTKSMSMKHLLNQEERGREGQKINQANERQCKWVQGTGDSGKSLTCTRRRSEPDTSGLFQPQRDCHCTLIKW